jgi:hypothetical protein
MSAIISVPSPVILSKAKDLAVHREILRFAQDDIPYLFMKLHLNAKKLANHSEAGV